MGWLIFLLLMLPASGLLFDVIFGLFLDRHTRLGQWAFRARADGTFSRWQIVGQILIIGPLVIICLIGMARCVLDVTKN